MSDMEFGEEEEIDHFALKLAMYKNQAVIQEEGFFKFDTGDTYEGNFEMNKKNRTIKMHGRGSYKTKEGEIYTGNWNQDRLGLGGDEVKVSFPDGASYVGMFQNFAYNGSGTYMYPDGTLLDCTFSENCPVGNLQLCDPNGHKWLGKAEAGFAWFKPVNHYYDILETSVNKKKKPK